MPRFFYLNLKKGPKIRERHGVSRGVCKAWGSLVPRFFYLDLKKGPKIRERHGVSRGVC